MNATVARYIPLFAQKKGGLSPSKVSVICSLNMVRPQLARRQTGASGMTANAWIGSAVERVEDERFVRGLGTFAADLGSEAQLHACILRSSVAHGRIDAVDATAARRLAGVVAVITAKEIGRASCRERV